MEQYTKIYKIEYLQKKKKSIRYRNSLWNATQKIYFWAKGFIPQTWATVSKRKKNGTRWFQMNTEENTYNFNSITYGICVYKLERNT